MKRTAVYGFIVSVFVLLSIEGCKSSGSVQDIPDPSLRIRDIYAGVANVFIIREDGTLWTAGYNRSGQLGLGETENPAAIVQIKDGAADFVGAKSVAAGENHTLVLKEDGTLWAAGESFYGELGLGNDGTGKLPVFIRLKSGGTDGEFISGVQTAAAGNNSTFFIKEDGTLWAGGYNYYGELGLGDRENHPVFTRVSSAGSGVIEVSAGVRHTVILKNDGTVWTAGYNFNGQLGLGIPEDASVFTQVQDIGSQAAAAAAGNYHTVVLKKDGTVWIAGENYYGQLGWSDQADQRRFIQAADDNGPLTDVKAIAARGDLTLVLKNDGSLFLAGNYSEPEPMGDEVYVVQNQPDREKPKSTFAPLIPEGNAPLGEIKKIGLGYQSIYVITADGRLWAAGNNRYGQLNMGEATLASSFLKQVYP